MQTGEPDADPFLIALAQSEAAIIITQEKDEVNKIPAVARHYNIECINLFEFFKKRGLKFVKEDNGT